MSLQYITSKRGEFVDIDSKQVVGYHEGIHQWTVGQRCRLASFLKPYFVAQKDVLTNTIYVASGTENPALYSDKIYATNINWICPDPLLESNASVRCRFRFQHTKPLVDCQLYRRYDNETGELVIKLDKPLRAITPGQYAVFYSDQECLGSARIVKAVNSDEKQQQVEEVLENS